MADHGEGERPREKEMGRRQALKILGAGAATILGGPALAEGVGAVAEALRGAFTKRGELSKPNEQQSLSEIAVYRKTFGLSPLPLELKNALKDKDYPREWKLHLSPTLNRLPITLKPYGEEAIKIVKVIFGPKANHLIRNIKLHPTIPGEFDYDSSEYALLFPYNINDYLAETALSDFILHEGVGHGSDPYYDTRRPENLYPFPVLLTIEHGKWRMLDQAFAIPGQFLNHPEDEALPKIKKFLGESLLEKLNTPGSAWFKNRYTLFLVQKALTQAQNENKSSAATGDKALMSFGGKIFDLFRQGKVQFMEEYADSIEQVIDDYLGEIYAEMMKMAILHPERIGNNQEILGGCQEIIEAIRGEKINFRDIHDSLKGL